MACPQRNSTSRILLNAPEHDAKVKAPLQLTFWTR
jgi:hypothetical protein